MAHFFLLIKLSLNAIRKFSSCIHVNEAYILSAVRTPIGSFQGKLAPLSAVQLGAKALTAAVEKAGINREDVQELVLGNCIQAGLGQGPGRQISLCGGLSTSCIASSVNKLCASGMKALMIGCQAISTMSQEVVAVVGAESLSNVPFMLRRKNMKLGNLCLPDLIFHDGLNDVFHQLDVTHFAEETVTEYKVLKEDQDNYALESLARAAKAQEEGIFAAELIPVVLKNKDGKEETVCEDEEIKNNKPDKLKHLPPLVGRGGTITAGNSSGLQDGASAIILASGNFVVKKGLTPLGKVVAFADAAVAPKQFCLSPSVVIPKVLVKANLTPERICFWEINETFALTALLNARLLKINFNILNVHGGAISLGHPFGMTGLRLIAHLIHVMQKGQLGCACISHATGGGSAVVVEKM